MRIVPCRSAQNSNCPSVAQAGRSRHRLAAARSILPMTIFGCFAHGHTRRLARRRLSGHPTDSIISRSGRSTARPNPGRRAASGSTSLASAGGAGRPAPSRGSGGYQMRRSSSWPILLIAFCHSGDFDIGLELAPCFTLTAWTPGVNRSSAVYAARHRNIFQQSDKAAGDAGDPGGLPGGGLCGSELWLYLVSRVRHHPRSRGRPAAPIFVSGGRATMSLRWPAEIAP